MSFLARWIICTALVAFAGVWARDGLTYALWMTSTVAGTALFGLLAALSSYAGMPPKGD